MRANPSSLAIPNAAGTDHADVGADAGADIAGI
jgi:hypothetical protein